MIGCLRLRGILAAAVISALFVLAALAGLWRTRGNARSARSNAYASPAVSAPADAPQSAFPAAGTDFNPMDQARMLRLARKAATATAAATAVLPSPDFLARQKQDQERYSKTQYDQIDAWYRQGLDERDPDSSHAWEALIRQYPDANRAHCAAMNLAARYYRQGNSHRGEVHLKRIAATRTDAVFANGEKVLPKALHRLGLQYRKEGRDDLADPLFARLLQEFSDDIDGEGVTWKERLALSDP